MSICVIVWSTMDGGMIATLVWGEGGREGGRGGYDG